MPALRPKPLRRAHAQRYSPRPRGISLPEILVVFGVIALLLAVLVPSLGFARELARRMVCANNMRQWGLALQMYRNDFDDFLPMEGYATKKGIKQAGAWYNALPHYLGAPRYRDVEGVGDAIKEFPNIDVWICPSKNRTDAFKSGTGKNQFHYGMNRVLDGMGSGSPTSDTPGFPERDKPFHLHGSRFERHPSTVFMFDISPNAPGGSPRNVATMYQRFRGRPVSKFHGDFANVVFLSGRVANCTTDDLVTDRDFKHGDIVWDNPRLYWGYLPVDQEN